MFLRGMVVSLLLLLAGSAPLSAMQLPHAADVNLDGKINIVDLIAVRNHLNVSPSTPGVFRSDVNADGRVNIVDLVALRNHLGSVLPRREFFFDFGTQASPTASGAIRVDPAAAYDSSVGYGWSGPDDRSFLSAENRDWEDPLDRDFIKGDRVATFRVDVPPGNYEVYVRGAYGDDTTAMVFGIKDAVVAGAHYTSQAHGTALIIYPKPEENVQRFVNVATQEGKIEVNFDRFSGSWWAVSAVEIRKDLPDIVLYNVHLDADRNYDFSPPTRDSNLDFVSQKFGDYQQDWDYIAAWHQDVIDDTMTTAEKVQAVIQKMFNTLELKVTSLFHPVDVLEAGLAECEQRATAFQYMMHTMGLPTRGVWLFALPESRHDTIALSPDPLGYSEQFHTAAEVFYDGRWHFYDANYGALYDCSIVELVADPTIRAVLDQSSRYHDIFFFAEIEEVYFLIDMNRWRVSGTADRIQYTPQTARTLFGDSLLSYPFRLQAKRPGFEPDEMVLPLIRSYAYNTFVPALKLKAGDIIRRDVRISPTEGVERLSNQLNIKAFPENTQLDLALTVNGHQYTVSVPAKAGPPEYVAVTVDVPPQYLREGTNTIDIQLLQPQTLWVAYAYERQDVGFVFPVVQRATADTPSTFERLPRHLFWNVDLVYKLNHVRSSPREMEFDLSKISGIEKSVFMLSATAPEEVLGAELPPDFSPLGDWDYDGVNLTLRQLPAYVRIKR